MAGRNKVVKPYREFLKPAMMEESLSLKWNIIGIPHDIIMKIKKKLLSFLHQMLPKIEKSGKNILWTPKILWVIFVLVR